MQDNVNMKNCKAEGCDYPIRAGKYCGAHYKRDKLGMSMTEPIKRRVSQNIPGYRRCSKCKQLKPEDRFYCAFEKGRLKYASRCKICKAEDLRLKRQAKAAVENE